jgi:hypothetical protein
VVGRGLAVGVGRHRHDHAGARGGVEVDRVRADPDSGDHAQSGRPGQDGLVEAVRADDGGDRRVGQRRQLVARPLPEVRLVAHLEPGRPQSGAGSGFVDVVVEPRHEDLIGAGSDTSGLRERAGHSRLVIRSLGVSLGQAKACSFLGHDVEVGGRVRGNTIAGEGDGGRGVYTGEWERDVSSRQATVTLVKRVPDPPAGRVTVRPSGLQRDVVC